LRAFTESVRSLDFIKDNSFAIYGSTNIVEQGWFVKAIAAPDVLYKLQTYDLILKSKNLSLDMVNTQDEIIKYKILIITNIETTSEINEDIWKIKRKKTLLISGSIGIGIGATVVILIRSLLK